MSTTQVEGLSNVSSGVGRTIDVAQELGNGVAVIPKCVVVTETAAAAANNSLSPFCATAQLQTGVASAAGITWTPSARPSS